MFNPPCWRSNSKSQNWVNFSDFQPILAQRLLAWRRPWRGPWSLAARHRVSRRRRRATGPLRRSDGGSCTARWAHRSALCLFVQMIRSCARARRRECRRAWPSMAAFRAAAVARTTSAAAVDRCRPCCSHLRAAVRELASLHLSSSGSVQLRYSHHSGC